MEIRIGQFIQIRPEMVNEIAQDHYDEGMYIEAEVITHIGNTNSKLMVKNVDKVSIDVYYQGLELMLFLNEVELCETFAKGI